MSFWVWGANNYGQLGLGTNTEQENVPVQNTLLSIHCDDCRQIAGGGGHTLVLDTGGALHVAGWNLAGQLGLGHETSVNTFTRVNIVENIVAVAAGWDFSLLLSDNGDVFSCGSNSFGQLGQLLQFNFVNKT